MKKLSCRILIFFLSCLVYSPVISQPGFPLNQKDEFGKKTGFWIIYLTDKLIPTKDSLEASYYAYNLYFFGGDFSFISDCKKEKRKASKITVEGTKGAKGKPVLMNGNYKIYNKKGKLVLSETYKNGLPVHFESYYVKNQLKPSINEIINWSEAIDDQLGSYCYTIFRTDDSVYKAACLKKKEGKWVFE